MAYQTKLTCPICNSEAVTKARKITVSVLGGKVDCMSCGATLVPRGIFAVNFSIELICHIALVLIGVYTIFTGTWMFLLAAIVLYLGISGLPNYFGGFKEDEYK